jgi:heptosyltransferase-2
MHDTWEMPLGNDCYTRGMIRADRHFDPRRILIVMPNWLGDTVMATPTLRALRLKFPQAHITVLLRRHLRPILADCPWLDRMVSIPPGTKSGKKSRRRSGNPLLMAARLSSGRFDMAVLLPNSFRWALTIWMARIKKRIGYVRDGRGGLLTDKLQPKRGKDGFVPVCTRDYYLDIARELGSARPDPRLQLFTRAADDERADRLLESAGWNRGAAQPLVVMTPGANFGDAKIWSADRFAAVADQCVDQLGAAVALSGAPGERPILDQIAKSAKHPIIDLPAQGMDLRLLKSVIKRADVVLTNDTGPRHIAIAMGRPVVTIFGPTDPAWTEMHFAHERQSRVDVHCSPCQKKTCPLKDTDEELQCMRKIEAPAVFEQVRSLLKSVDELS